MMSREERSDFLLKEIEDKERRERIHKIIGRFLICFFTVVAIVFSLFLYMRFVSTSNLIVREYKVVKDSLPDSYNGLRIVHFTDLHYNSTVNKGSFLNVVSKINNLKPDIVVFTGDLVSEEDLLTDDDVNDIIECLNKIEATVGKYAVRGNHDYHDDYFNKVFDQTDFIFLDNTYDLIYYNDNTPILINGIGSNIKGDVDIGKAFSPQVKVSNDDFNNSDGSNDIGFDNNDDLFTISLVHEPDLLDDILLKYNVDLCLSGHSHNGQIRLPFIGALKTIEGARKYDDSYYKVGDTDLYVSGGIGTSLYKLRFFNRPSINFYRVTKR